MSVANIFGQSPALPVNLAVEGTLSLGSTQQVTTYTNQITTSTTAATSYLTISGTGSSSLIDIRIYARGYTTTGSPGYGVVSEIENAYSFLSGTLIYSSSVGTDVNQRFGYPVNATPLGALVTVSGTNLLCQVQNGFSGNSTDWVITTIVTTVT